jgi:hypothetical protein
VLTGDRAKGLQLPFQTPLPRTQLAQILVLLAGVLGEPSI